MDSRIKGQASMEVVLLVGFLFAVFVVFIAFVNGQLTDKRAEIELQLLEDVSKKVQGEINIAKAEARIKLLINYSSENRANPEEIFELQEKIKFAQISIASAKQTAGLL